MTFRSWLVLAFLFLASGAWGAVTSEVSRSDYVGNGATAIYSTTFPVKATSEVRVFGQDAAGQDDELTLGVDYTASLNASTGICTITLSDGNLANGYKLSLQRGIPYTQTYNPSQSGAYNAASLGTALDRLAMEVVRLKGDVDRSIKIPYLEAGGDTVTKLDDPASDRANQSLGFDSSGNVMVGASVSGIDASPFAQTLLDDTTATEARNTLGATAGVWPVASGGSGGMAARTVLANDTAGAANGTATTIDSLTVLATSSVTRRTSAARFGEIVNVKDHGAIGDNSTDDTAAIQAAAARLQALGGGTLFFPPGTYKVFSATTGTLCSFSGLSSISCLGHGATLEVPTSKSITASEGYFFYFSNCKNITVDGFTTNGPTLDVSSTNVKGYEFVRCVNGCRNISMPNNRVRNSLAGFICSKLLADADSMRTQNIHIGVLDVVNCWYGINGQYSGDFMRVDCLRTDTVHRSCFIYGASNLSLNIWSKDHKAVDVPLSATDGVAMTNVEVNYHSGIDSTACGNASKVQIGWSGTTASELRNIRINLDVRFHTSGTTGGAALNIRKVDGSGNSDAVDRGHQLNGLTVSGAIIGVGTYTGDGATSVVTDVNCTWGTGDFFSNLCFDNFVITAGAAIGKPILTLANLTDRLIMRNVKCDRSIVVRQSVADVRLPHAGQILLDGVTCANRFAYDGTDLAHPLDYIRGTGAAETVRAGWSSKIITNTGVGGTVTWTLPAAVVGLEYEFVRQDAQTMDIDPSGSEIIRGGTAGQLLRMTTAGNMVRLRCSIAGVWEVVSAQGAYTFV